MFECTPATNFYQKLIHRDCLCGSWSACIWLQAAVIPTCRELGIGIVPYSPLGESGARNIHA